MRLCARASDLALSSFVATYYFYATWFISVWYFFAALLSITNYFHFDLHGAERTGCHLQARTSNPARSITVIWPQWW